MTETTYTESPADEEAPDADLPKMSFLDHLEELRKRLIISIIAVFVAFLACWNYADKIFGLIQAPLTKFLPPGDQKLAYTRLTEPFFLYMKVAFFAAIFVASPILMWQVWRFISPGLYKRERRYAAPFIIFATLFFIGGGYFGYRVILPGTCAFFVESGRQFKQMIKVDEYFSFASTIVLASGAVFETPILIFFLARLGIVTPHFLLQKSKYAIVLSFIIAAVVTPTPDMVTQSFLAVPMIALYFLGVGVAFMFGKRRDA
ncbi:MAG: twin-arginine translocase subunit TatC [Acidobacteria bacterium]|nr:twin-arginine translocase subunit TatC [Acidobacteriota bacterium]MBV9071493.1 twin-arginine translocase subunit TatC [Acidobacteriota bacterium]MBV9186338.1 twin-arginine translocase subunit TatC [Acidobacteriota bacterium]